MPNRQRICNAQVDNVLMLGVHFARSNFVPDVGMRAFRFRNEKRQRNGATDPKPPSLALAITVDLGVDLQPGLLLFRTQLRHHLHQVTDHLFADSADQR